jgi:hypothetical protein
LGASLIADGGDVDTAAMLGVAWRAFDRFCVCGPRGDGVMDGAVVAGETGAVGGFCGEDTGLLEVASGAFFFEYGVSGAHAAAGIDAGVSCGGTPSYPDQGDDRKQKAEPEFGAPVPRRPFEIVEVDPLGEFFCGASAHFLGQSTSHS